MFSSADNERKTNYFASVDSAYDVAKNKLERIKAKRGGEIDKDAIDRVVDETFDPILDEYSDLDNETLFPKLTEITLKIRNAFLGEKIITGLSKNTEEVKTKSDQKPENNKAEPHQESFSNRASYLQSMLLENQNKTFLFDADKDLVKEAFNSIYSVFEEIKSVFYSTNSKEIKELEVEILHQEYKHRRKSGLQRLSRMESMFTEIDATSFAQSLETPMIGIIKTTILPRLKELDDSEIKKYENDFKALEKQYFSRKYLLISWFRSRPYIFDGVGEGENKKRKTMGAVSAEDFPLLGGFIEETIHGGFGVESEFGGEFNISLGKRKVEIPSRSEHGKTEKMDIEETIFDWMMAYLDDVYDNQQNPVIDGIKINTQNVRDYSELLIKALHEAGQEELKRRGIDKELSDNKLIAKRAFRAHTMITLNHCYLAHSSPFLPDYIYYMFNWPEYAIKYFDQNVGKFDPVITFLLFSYLDAIDENGKPTDSNFLAQISSKQKVSEIRNELQHLGVLDSSRGVKALHSLYKGYVIRLENVSQYGDSKYPFITPPLRYMLIDEVDENGVAKVDSEGKIIKKRMPTKPGKDGKRPQGKLQTYDDLIEIVTETKEEKETGKEISKQRSKRLYSEMDFSKKENDFIAYYNALDAHGINFLEMFLYTSKKDFLGKMDNPEFFKSLRNQAKYSAQILPRVGSRCQAGEKDPQNDNKSLSESIMDLIVVQLIFIKCVLHTNKSLDENYWDDIKIGSYLANLLAERIISKEEAKAVEKAVKKLRGAELFFEGIKRSTISQMKNANFFR